MEMEEKIVKQSTFVLMVWGLLMPIMLVSPALAAEFHVTDADTFRDALSTSSTNGEDDIIYLDEGTYGGNFRFYPSDSRTLLIKGEPETSPGNIILDGQASGMVSDSLSRQQRGPFQKAFCWMRLGVLTSRQDGMTPSPTSGDTRGLIP